MKIEIDFKNKTVKILEIVNIKEFFDELKKIIPQDEYDKWQLLYAHEWTTTPILVPIYPTYPINPIIPNNPWITIY